MIVRASLSLILPPAPYYPSSSLQSYGLWLGLSLGARILDTFMPIWAVAVVVIRLGRSETVGLDMQEEAPILDRTPVSSPERARLLQPKAHFTP